MGKAISTSIKKHAEEMLEKFPDKFSENFDPNKQSLREFSLPFSKTERNLMAGHIVRIKKAEKKK